MVNLAASWLLTPVRRLGQYPLSFVDDMGRMGIFLSQTLYDTFSSRMKFFRVLEQLKFIGFGSVLVVVLTGAFTGMVLGFQGRA